MHDLFPSKRPRSGDEDADLLQTFELDAFMEAAEEGSADLMRFLDVALGYVVGMTTSTFILLSVSHLKDV
ncbi:MAG TPA: hypothetical protein VK446_13880 [Methylocystis sp.]|nr:hypothetical protein [Methylocystis sp.]